MKFAEHQAQDRRLVILRVLSEAASYTSNEYLLQQVLADAGHHVSQDTLRSDLSWLHEQALLDLSSPGQMFVVKLLTRGLDVSQGRAICPGVKKPLPF